MRMRTSGTAASRKPRLPPPPPSPSHLLACSSHHRARCSALRRPLLPPVACPPPPIFPVSLSLPDFVTAVWHHMFSDNSRGSQSQGEASGGRGHGWCRAEGVCLGSRPCRHLGVFALPSLQLQLERQSARTREAAWQQRVASLETDKAALDERLQQAESQGHRLRAELQRKEKA
jgi:hypothetical protein